MVGADSPTSRWSFLDYEGDACVVVTRRMEIVHRNVAAGALVPSGALGLRCWEVFPVGDTRCAARCPAVKAVSSGGGLFFCEETLFPEDGSVVPVGVVVIPLEAAEPDGGKAVLLLRPATPELTGESLQQDLLEKAQRLLHLCR